MGKLRGFLEFSRESPLVEKPHERVGHFREFEILPSPEALREQGARCMNCGIPFCHNGCPLGNEIPDWNDLVWKDRWDRALLRLHATNNFPEFTGRICPAPCESSCVLNINDDPVSIKQIERAIADRGFEDGRIEPVIAAERSGRRVAIVGSGPAGLACAQQLARAGHDVVVFERDEAIGGLLRLGIPDFKLDKALIDRRVEQMRAEGVRFRTGIQVGRDVSGSELRSEFDAICLATGATAPRDLPLPGRELSGVAYAMDFLTRQNRLVAAGEPSPAEGAPLADLDASSELDAFEKRVVVLGGGDTGSDCVGTANRQGARAVTQIEIMPRPPEERADDDLWPHWPWILRTSSSQEEGVERDFGILTERFVGDAAGRVRALQAVRIEWRDEPHPDRSGETRRAFSPVPGTQFEIPCDLVLLALGFTGTEANPLYEELGVRRDGRANVAASQENYRTDAPDVFACGDARRGQSLVVWAIWEGREAARAIDAHLRGRPTLPSRPAPMPI